ncbi:MAG: AbrB/MazE/SpoVT family DNA-binding domain-containing protein [Clostridia bacterium]|nr:AbrB/MazE/SpoVT family DNA-binding domain-containing protein [Clostridia bacterium]
MEIFVAFKKMDRLGRVVIPKDMRHYFDIMPNDYIKITPTENGVLLTASKGKRKSKVK